MSQALSHNSIYPELAAIPHGPHRLSRDEVATSQLARLRAAVVALVAERGYAAVTIAAIARQARVSPNVFYQHFDDKQTCFLDAYDTFAAVVVDRVGNAAGDTLTAYIETMLTAYLGLLDREPHAARAFMLEIDGVGAFGRSRRRDFYDVATAGIAAGHDGFREHGTTTPPTPDIVYMGIVQGIHGIASDALEVNPTGNLVDLIPDLVAWIVPTLERT